MSASSSLKFWLMCRQCVYQAVLSPPELPKRELRAIFTLYLTHPPMSLYFRVQNLGHYLVANANFLALINSVPPSTCIYLFRCIQCVWLIPNVYVQVPPPPPSRGVLFCFLTLNFLSYPTNSKFLCYTTFNWREDSYIIIFKPRWI